MESKKKEVKAATTKKTARRKTTTKKAVTPKSKKAVEAKIDEVQETEAVQKVITHRKLKYKYPDGMTDTLERKSFRQTERNKLKRLETAWLKAPEGRKKDIALKKLDKKKSEVLL